MWKLDELYLSKKEWLSDITLLSETLNKNFEIPHLSLDNAETIFSFLEEWLIKLDRVDTYAILLRNLNIADSNVWSEYEQVSRLFNLFHQKTNQIDQFIKQNASKLLVMFEQHNKPVWISAVKRILDSGSDDIPTSMYQKVQPLDDFRTWFFEKSNIGHFESDGITVSVTFENLVSLLAYENRSIRKKTYLAVEYHLDQHKKRAANDLNAHFQLSNAIAQQQKYLTSFELAFSKLPVHVTSNFYSHFFTTIQSHFAYLLDQKKEILHLNTISFYDLYVSNSEIKSISPELAEQLIIHSYQAFPSIQKVVTNAFHENWIDWKLGEGKDPGARSFSSYNTHPFITINWTGDLESLDTLAHEVAGAVAQHMAASQKNIFVFELSVFKTEVFSFVGELLLLRYLQSVDLSLYNISSLSVQQKILDVIKDGFFNSYSTSIVQKRLSKEALYTKLTAENISEIFETTVNEFHESPIFESFPENKVNWVKYIQIYYNEYNLWYVFSFLTAILTTKNNDMINVIHRLNEKGELLTDAEYVTQIFKTQLTDTLIKQSIDKINQIIRTGRV